MIRVRFAPSPTGYLHLGNIRTALFNYLFAKRTGGKFILRIEDTDQERSRLEFEEALKEDLLWMGLRWDEGPDVGGEHGPYRQSERSGIYSEYIDRLIKEKKAYYCYVTEEETTEMKRLALEERRSVRHDNRGRNFTRAEIESRKVRGIKPTVRFKIDQPELSLNDLVRGDVSFNLDDMVGDFIIQRADGQPTFHLAVCVDDALMGVTHVIRGEDHLSNTPKHILLTRAMGHEPPKYGHLSLVQGPGGEPLSKRMESISIKEFRRRGYLPHALANYIALLGWSPGGDREILNWEELQHLFDITKTSRSASSFDPQKLDWANGEHLRLLSEDAFCRVAAAYLKAYKHVPFDEVFLKTALPAFKENIERLEQLEDRFGIFSDDFKYENSDALKSAESREIFEVGLAVLKTMVETGQAGAEEFCYEAFVNGIKPKVRAKGKKLFLPLRIALTGREHGPELKKIFPAFGAERVRLRLERALGKY
ncbi:MAG: glutamate--tRNA ligase [Candidatus Omnitrophota bacterium]|nr:glutamate--tRNA ligase [Candidatus Omnitrophota bacterium]